GEARAVHRGTGPEVALAVPGHHGDVLGGDQGVEEAGRLQRRFQIRTLTFRQFAVESDELPQGHTVTGRPLGGSATGRGGGVYAGGFEVRLGAGFGGFGRGGGLLRAVEGDAGAVAGLLGAACRLLGGAHGLDARGAGRGERGGAAGKAGGLGVGRGPGEAG